MKNIRSLDDLMDGAALQRFNKCLREVLPVMENPNMFFLRKNLVFGFSFLILRSER